MAGISFERSGLYDSPHDGKELVSSKRLGFALYMGLTIMLFAGLFGGWFVLRGTNQEWPPAYVPPMRIVDILSSSAFLVLSIALMRLARKRVEQTDFAGFRRVMLMAVASSVLFIAAFLAEWMRLINAGVGMVDVFGSMYLVITGAYLLHFIGGMIGQILFLRKNVSVRMLLEKNAGFFNTQAWYYLMMLLWLFIIFLMYV